MSGASLPARLATFGHSPLGELDGVELGERALAPSSRSSSLAWT